MYWLNTVTKYCAMILVLVITGCSSTGSASQSTANTETLSLRERLDQKGGVTVQGKYADTRVYIRGESSLSNPGQQPLFVVDDQKMGRNFYDVASKFTPEQIVSIKVLSGAGANMYGGEGGNGVIVIKTSR